MIDWSKIKPCPECGSSESDLEYKDTVKANRYVLCMDCGHEGPVATGNYKDEHETITLQAIDYWNKQNDDH